MLHRFNTNETVVVNKVFQFYSVCQCWVNSSSVQHWVNNGVEVMFSVLNELLVLKMYITWLVLLVINDVLNEHSVY